MATKSNKTYDDKAATTIGRLLQAHEDGNFDEVFDEIFPPPKEEDVDKPDR